MGRDDHIRIGTTEREEAISALGEHFSAGRLEVAEYEERCAVAAGARTQAELSALFHDLPTPRSEVDPARADPLVRHDNPRSNKVAFAVFGGVALAAVVVVVAMTATWYLLAPILIIGVVLLMMS